jgi:hypothetical protein
VETPVIAGPVVPRPWRVAINAVCAVFLILLLWHVVHAYAPFVVMPWFNMSDENVVVGEVIRFAAGDIHQQFFDMPGTPLMLLGAVEWRIWHRLAGPSGQSIIDFSFANIQQLFELMRTTSLVLYCGTILLLFGLAARLMNRFAAVVACLVFVLNGAFGNMLTFLRVEPAAAFCIVAALLLLNAPTLRWPYVLVAGLLAGIAAGCRLHSITLTVPLFSLVLWTRTWKRETCHPRWFGALAAAVGVLALGGSVYAYRNMAAIGSTAFPLATAFLAKAFLAAAVAVFAIGLLHAIPATRRYALKSITPEFLSLTAGMAGGFFVSTFTIFPQWTAFLRTLDFYNSSGYQDQVASKLPLAAKVTSLFSFYMRLVAQDWAVVLLLVAGSAVILIHPRWRRLWPYLAIAFAFFVTRSLNLQRAPHHIALWIPFFALVCAAGPAALVDYFERRLPERRHLVWAVSLVVLLALPLLLSDGGLGGRTDMLSHRERLRNVERSRAWIHANVPPLSEVHTAFYCFGPDIFYGWMRSMNVPMPPQLGTDRDYRIWWWQRSAIDGHTGYACFGPELDIPFMKQPRQPGDGLDPPNDPHFQRLQSFGEARNRIDVYRFDLRH